MARATLVGVVAGLAFVAMPGVASAGTASLSGGELVFQAAGGEGNVLTVETVGANFQVIDTGAALTAGAGCSQVDPQQALCPTAGATLIRATLRNGDDDSAILNGTTPAVINGGVGLDRLVGAAGGDTLIAGAGPGAGAGTATEILFGQGGADTLLGSAESGGSVSYLGGEGDDMETGGRGSDSFFGEPGADTIRGGDASDQLSYSGATDPAGVTVSLGAGANDGAPGEGDNVFGDVETLSGSNFDDLITGTTGTQSISGGDGADTLRGAAGSDLLSGQNGADDLQGGDDIDGMVGGAGADGFSGGNSGADIVSYVDQTNAGTAMNISVNNLAGDGAAGENDNVRADVEIVAGGAGPDTMSGNGAENTLYGAGGADSLAGSGGDDTLSGDGSVFLPFITLTFPPPPTPGADVLNGATGDDTLEGGGAGDQFVGGPDDDMVTYASTFTGVTVTVGSPPADGSNDGAPGEGDNVRADVEGVTGSSGPDDITGSATDNVLLGGPASDELHGDSGNDYFEGDTGTFLPGPPPPSGGADTFDGGAGTDTVSYGFSSLAVTVDIDAAVGDDGTGNGSEGDTVEPDIENLSGSKAGDTLTGNGAANLLMGRDGQDTLSGLNGNDSLDGGPDDDTSLGGNNDDFIRSRGDFAVSPGATTIDTDNCGAGNDTVVPDPFDVTSDCETVS